MELRDYQKDIIAKMVEADTGRHIIKAATGLGKTVIFTNYPHRGRQLVIVNRDELVWQTVEKFNDGRTVGVEKAEQSSNGTEDVVVASIQSLHRRLENYSPHDFTDIHVDELQYAAARTYHKTLDYFKPIAVWGFSATPARNDNVRLDDIFDDIIVDYDILWGIENGWLCDIKCRMVNLGIDLSNVKQSNGDFNLTQLDKAMDETSDGIIEVYHKYHVGQTLIFAASIKKAYEIANGIKDAKVVEANTKLEDRRRWIADFKDKKIPALVNFGTLIAGFDAPCIETIIFGRPTTNNSLFTQALGRGTRTYPGKECLHFIDCTRSSSVADICAPGCIIGFDLPPAAEKRIKSEDEFNLKELPRIATDLANRPETWIKSISDVNLFRKKHKLNLRELAFRKLADGRLQITAAPKVKYYIPPISTLGTVNLPGVGEIKAQEAVDMLFAHLKKVHYDSKSLWSKKHATWQGNPATGKQMEIITKWHVSGKFDFEGVDINTLTCGEASCIIDEVFGR